jgi:hypothetical protein
VDIVSSTLRVLLDYDLPTCPSSLGAYVCIATLWRTILELVPLSPSDERLLTEPTEDEIKAGEHLPYPNVLGVVQYPSNFTKMEVRYAMSVLSRHRTKWGLTHFKILLKALEYGWSTRAMG